MAKTRKPTTGRTKATKGRGDGASRDVAASSAKNTSKPRKSRSLSKASKRASRGKQVRRAAAPKSRLTKAKAKRQRRVTTRKLATRKGKFARRVLIYTDGVERAIKVASANMAGRVGSYMSAVSWLITHNDPSRLVEFDGVYVTDAKGKRYALETRPNFLYRLSHSGGPSFESIYRVVAR